MVLQPVRPTGRPLASAPQEGAALEPSPSAAPVAQLALPTSAPAALVHGAGPKVPGLVPPAATTTDVAQHVAPIIRKRIAEIRDHLRLAHDAASAGELRVVDEHLS